MKSWGGWSSRAFVVGLCALGATSTSAAQTVCEAARLLAGQTREYSGRSVAVSGDILVNGAPTYYGPGPGSADVFRRDGAAWIHEQRLVPWDDAAAPMAQFGLAVVASGDTIMVGAPRTDNVGLESGSVYVFRFDGTSWVPFQRLLPSDGAAWDEFGQAVALSGARALILAPGHDVHERHIGTVYGFRFDGVQWVEEEEFYPLCSSCDRVTLRSLAMSSGVAVVGADICLDWYVDPYGHSYCLNGHEGAFVFRFDGFNWHEEAELVARAGPVAVADGVAVIGAPFDYVNGGYFGSAYVFRFNGAGWVQEAQLLASDGADGDRFGSSVAVDGDTLFIGVPEDDDAGLAAGSFYMFRYDGSGWIEEREFYASVGDYGDRFGGSLATGDGILVVGAPGDEQNGEQAGAAYAFELGGADCNGNLRCDARDVAEGTSQDANLNGIPDRCECLADMSGNGVVDVPDLLALLAAWGANPGGPPDFDGDGSVGVPDLLTLLAAWGPCYTPAIIIVPGDFDTIQGAINWAADGDEIVVGPGAYHETINFLGKAITLRSSEGPEVTTIDAQSSGAAVTCNSGERLDTVLDGFTITGGSGGGLRNRTSSPTVRNCTFMGNTAVGGGGMANELYSSPTVIGCTFLGNTAGGDGGGMRNATFSSPTVIGCTFLGNTAGGDGGGMANELYSSPTVIGCTFLGNTAGGDGGGMRNKCFNAPRVNNCIFTQNVANAMGGAIANSTSDPEFANCTIVGNTAASGGALFVFVETVCNNALGVPRLTNCIVWDNGPDQIFSAPPAFALVRFSDIQGGFPDIGNIDADPIFVDPINGDYRLAPFSPCIDAGDNTAVPEGITTDLDGNPRFVDDPLTSDTGNGVPPIVDMGAYEFQGGCPPPLPPP